MEMEEEALAFSVESWFLPSFNAARTAGKTAFIVISAKKPLAAIAR